jgi:mono/diheme cytochrome c family protein
MKSVMTVFLVLLLGMAASAWAQGGSVEKGKAIVESKHCALCHKVPQPGKAALGKPMEMVAGTNNDAYLKGAIADPKKTLGPQVKMPQFKLTDAELQDVIAYLRSIAKH